jgi:VanZ family protein
MNGTLEERNSSDWIFMPSFIKTFLYYYLPVFLWCVLIFVLSSQSNLPGPDTAVFDFIFKKAAHMFVYAILYFLLFRSLKRDTHKKHFFFAFVLCMLYAITDEVHQRFTPGRTSTARDFGYDVLGMSVMLFRLKGWI